MIAPSGTTMTDYNPAFSVIDWDKEFMVPVNIHTYYLNITETNLSDKPVWKLLHDLKNEYDLLDLSPDSMSNFLDRLYANGTLASRFEWNRDRRRT
jgi:sphingomyelin phosphodiesterase